MRELFEDFLFSRGYFVRAREHEHAPELLVALAKLFNIRIVKNPEWASVHMVKVAQRNLGEDVPLPFYRDFPESVLRLSLGEIVIDRLLHYARTYGRGDFSRPGHSLFEEEVVRKCFDEETEVRDFAIISEEEALELVTNAAESLLASTRPLSDGQYKIVLAYVEEFRHDAKPSCKDTVVRLLLDTRNDDFARLLKLSDVIRLVEYLQFQSYEDASIKKLNLRNRDRVLLTRVLDRIFQDGECDMRTCLEKKKQWKGLLHHLHYKPVNDVAKRFLADVRDDETHSVYSRFEQFMAADEVQMALDYLRAEKGAGAVLRNLDYLLSRCPSPAAVDYVLDAVQTDNKILLIQLLHHYYRNNADSKRVFKFQKFGMIRVHEETDEEFSRCKTVLSDAVATRARWRVWKELERACRGTLGKVYVDKDMLRIALPLQEGASQDGVGTLPRGSRLPIPAGKKIRAFTYWERVDDIDLSAFALSADGTQVEFSWRTVSDADSIVYSGDQTSGYDGGSEYFDIDLDLFREEYPGARYIVLCDNVYSRVEFSKCVCRAGFMMRDVEDSGEVFEPKTVKSSYAVTCPSTFAYLFAIDVEKREIVWLNMARDSAARVAGTTKMAFLLDYLYATDAISLYHFACMLATEEVEDPRDADVVFSDKDEPMRDGAERIRSVDAERIIGLLA